MKYSFFLLLLAFNIDLGQMRRQLPPPAVDQSLSPQADVLNEGIFRRFKNTYSDKNLKFRLNTEKSALTVALQGMFSHKTAYGTSIYIIPLDHMACSVPDRLADERMLSRLPENFQNADPMPNGLPKVQIIPGINTSKNPFAGKFSAK